MGAAMRAMPHSRAELAPPLSIICTNHSPPGVQLLQAWYTHNMTAQHTCHQQPGPQLYAAGRALLIHQRACQFIQAQRQSTQPGRAVHSTHRRQRARQLSNTVRCSSATEDTEASSRSATEDAEKSSIPTAETSSRNSASEESNKAQPGSKQRKASSSDTPDFISSALTRRFG